jgi:hypothetical protein
VNADRASREDRGIALLAEGGWANPGETTIVKTDGTHIKAAVLLETTEMLRVQIAAFGVMMNPALAIDGKVQSVGKLLSPEEIKKLLA